jgi:hypothetical protein
VLELLLKLLDRWIDIKKSSQDVDRAFFADFVAPAIADFEAVHKDYLDSFRRYRDEIQNGKYDLDSFNPVFSMINQDSRSSRDLRLKLFELEKEHSLTAMGGLIRSIMEYLQLAFSETLEISPNVGRALFTQRLETVFERSSPRDRKKDALALIDDTVDGFQDRCQRVLHQQALLKKKLLGPT